MRKKIMYITAAFIFAFIGAIGFYTFQMNIFKPITVYESTTVLYRGDQIRKEDITDTIVYKGNIDEAYILDPNQIIGKYVKYDHAIGDKFKANKIIQESDLAEMYQNFLEEGESAVGVNTDLRQSVGGMIKAGDFVNVIAVNRGSNGENQSAVPILQNVEVLAVVNRQADMLSSTEESQTKQANISNSVSSQAYSDRTPSVVVLKVPTQEESLLAIHSEVTLSLNANNYSSYQPTVQRNVFSRTATITTSETEGGQI